MTVYVMRGGQLVEKHACAPRGEPDSRTLSAPHYSRPLSYESPVTGKEVTSWRERERDMDAAGAFDRRDLPKDHAFRRGREAQFEEARKQDGGSDFEWRGPA